VTTELLETEPRSRTTALRPNLKFKLTDYQR